MDNKLDRGLLYFFKAAVSGISGTYYLQLAAPEQACLREKLKSQKLLPLFYYFLHPILPEDLNSKLSLIYRKRSIIMLQMQVAFKELCQLFEQNQIRFAPFKGMDLAYRCYPAPALRYLSDWDVLIHPDDCVRALELLAGNGWQPERPVDLNTMHHHYSQHYKNGICLEPHRTFAQFGGVDAYDLWKYITPVAPGRFQHVLSAELNLLQSACHAASWMYSHQPAVKLLLDAAFLMQKNPVDWAELKQMARQWDLPYPGNLLSAYPEFWTPETLQIMQGDAEAAAAFRELVESNFDIENVEAGEFDLHDERGGVLQGVKHGFKRMSARSLRQKYHLPESGAYWRLSRCFIWDLLGKGGRFIKYMFCPDKQLKARRKLIKQAEALKND